MSEHGTPCTELQLLAQEFRIHTDAGKERHQETQERFDKLERNVIASHTDLGKKIDSLVHFKIRVLTIKEILAILFIIINASATIGVSYWAVKRQKEISGERTIGRVSIQTSSRSGR